MSAPRTPLSRIVVAGDGQLGVLAAIALRRALPACEVVVLQLPPHPAAFADRIGTALPFTNRLHDRLGIAEHDLVRQAGASHRLAVRYSGFGGPGHVAMASYGAETDPRFKTAFALEWGGGRRSAGQAASARSLGEVLAQAGRFVPPSGEDGSPLAEIDYALRWNVGAYRDLLVGLAGRMGVAHRDRPLAMVEPDASGGIAALVLEGGERIAADLFVDCSGPDAVLAGTLPGASRQGWDHLLPARAVAAAPPARPVLSLVDQVALTPCGWRWDMAGRDGAMRILAVASEGDLAAALETEPAQVIELRPGRLEQGWRGNVVALGEAFATLEPLAGIALDAAHRQLDLLLEVLPGKEFVEEERAEYNRRAGLIADRARDWVAAHYAAPAAAPLAARVTRSPELERALSHFARRQRLPYLEETPMSVLEWAAQLHALGVPTRPSALSEAGGENAGAIAEFEARAREALQHVPPYTAWLQQVLSAA